MTPDLGTTNNNREDEIILHTMFRNIPKNIPFYHPKAALAQLPAICDNSRPIFPGHSSNFLFAEVCSRHSNIFHAIILERCWWWIYLSRGMTPSDLTMLLGRSHFHSSFSTAACILKRLVFSHALANKDIAPLSSSSALCPAQDWSNNSVWVTIRWNCYLCHRSM